VYDKSPFYDLISAARFTGFWLLISHHDDESEASERTQTTTMTTLVNNYFGEFAFDIEKI